MADDVETGQGTEFMLADGTGALTKIGRLQEVPMPNTEAAGLLETSDMDTVGFKEFIQERLAEGVESDLEMFWVPGDATETLLLAAVGDRREYEITLPVDGGTRTVSGELLVRNFVRNNPRTEARTGTLTVKWMTVPVEAAGA
jgi:hypothetical protein